MAPWTRPAEHGSPSAHQVSPRSPRFSTILFFDSSKLAKYSPSDCPHGSTKKYSTDRPVWPTIDASSHTVSSSLLDCGIIRTTVLLCVCAAKKAPKKSLSRHSPLCLCHDGLADLQSLRDKHQRGPSLATLLPVHDLHLAFVLAPRVVQ